MGLVVLLISISNAVIVDLYSYLHCFYDSWMVFVLRIFRNISSITLISIAQIDPYYTLATVLTDYKFKQYFAYGLGRENIFSRSNPICILLNVVHTAVT